MKYITIADAQGVITQVHAAIAIDVADFEAPGVTVVEQWSDISVHYVSGGQVLARPSFNITVSGNVLIGVPQYAEVLIDGVSYMADGTDIEVEFTSVGKHTLLVRLWPYLNKSLEIEN